jgi:hypothetical protein
MYTHKIVDGVRIDLTPSEIAELEARDASYVAPVVTAPTTPTKEQLLAELQTLTAKINALE